MPTSIPPSDGAPRRNRRLPALVVAMALLGLSACTAAPTGETSTPAPSEAPTSVLPSMPASSSLVSPSPDVPSVSPPETAGLTIDVTVADGKVSPSGERYEVRRGTEVTLRVRSDIEDEIHAHTGGEGFELAVRPGRTATGSFMMEAVGSFEIESHELDKVIAILNVR